MKSSIGHLPQEKQQELQSITDAIVELVHPEMIILSGSYSRGDWVEDTYKENATIDLRPVRSKQAGRLCRCPV